MAVVGKGEMASRIAEKAGFSTAQASRALNAVLDAIADSLAKGDEVRLTGFGTFRVTETKERIGRNPRTGEPIKIPAGRRVSFSPSPRLTESAKSAA